MFFAIFSPVALALLALLTMPKVDALALGSAAKYGVLASTGISNAGTTNINGKCGVSAAGAITGAPTCSGGTELNTPVSLQGLTDCKAAYNRGITLPTTGTISTPLGGQTVYPGVYKFATSVAIGAGTTLTLALPAGSTDTSAKFIFQIGSTLGTGIGAQMVLGAGVQACNVFFLIGSSATLDSSTVLKGNFLALTSITVGSGANVAGLLCAQTGAVGLSSDIGAAPGCCFSTAE